MVAYKRFDATTIGRATSLHYCDGWSYKDIRDELDGPSLEVIRRWCRQFRGRSEAVRQHLGRLGEFVGKAFRDQTEEVFKALGRFAARCGVSEESEVIQVVQPVLLGHRTQAPLFRSG